MQFIQFDNLFFVHKIKTYLLICKLNCSLHLHFKTQGYTFVVCIT